MNRPEDHQAHSLAGDAQVSCCGSVAKSFLTLCDLMDCSTPGYPVLHYLLEFAQIDSSVHGILQAKILEWVAIPFSRGSSWPRNQTQVSGIGGRFLTVWAPGKPLGKGRPSPVLQWSRRCCNPRATQVLFLGRSELYISGVTTRQELEYKGQMLSHAEWKEFLNQNSIIC